MIDIKGLQRLFMETPLPNAESLADHGVTAKGREGFIKLWDSLPALFKAAEDGGLHVVCADCGKPLKEPGALRLYIGIPDAKGDFEGRKDHVCADCEAGIV